MNSLNVRDWAFQEFKIEITKETARSRNEPCNGSPCDTYCGKGWPVCGRSGMATVFTLQFRYTTLGNSCSITCKYTAIELQCTRSSVAVPVHALHCTQSSARDTVHPLQCTRTIRQNACAQEHALQCTSSSVRPTVHALQCTSSSVQPTMHALQCIAITA